MKLGEILKDLYSDYDATIEINYITTDTRNVKKNSLVILSEGETNDPHQLINDIEDNVSFYIAQKPIKTTKPYLLDPNISQNIAAILSNFFHHPETKMTHIGVTGTNGKTSVAKIIQSILAEEKKTAYIGTLGVDIDHSEVSISTTTPTTPQSAELFCLLDEFRKNGVSVNIMEVSSHALAQHRTNRIPFRYALFTNLTEEHLDYHHTMENYFEAKKQLFVDLEKSSHAILNGDSPYSSRIAAETNAHVHTFGLGENNCFRAVDIVYSDSHTEFNVLWNQSKYYFKTPLIGEYNVYNLLAAIAVSFLEGVPYSNIFTQLLEFRGVFGRLERVPAEERTVYIDYAHSPDSLENVLKTLHKIKKEQKIITVFGCGGDRDKTKRPVMGKIAEDWSDLVILTSDNPRTEDPIHIIQDIQQGMEKECVYHIDRKLAIKQALQLATPKDIVLIAGKGHETYQIIQDKRTTFNDKDVCLEIIDSLYQKTVSY